MGRSQEPKDTGQLSTSELGATGTPWLGTTGSGKIQAQDLASSFTCSGEDSEQVLVWLDLGSLLLMCGARLSLDSSLL